MLNQEKFLTIAHKRQPSSHNSFITWELNKKMYTQNKAQMFLQIPAKHLK